jgi:phospho-N-acetylmuramoyl-pentapeptide-transferase
VIAFWQFRNEAIYMNAHALDLAVVAAAMLGGCIGFLWWNAAPAQIFMGDTGSLAIGAAFATLALSTDTQLLLPILGGLFVVETASVMIQVGVYRMQRGTPPSQRRRPFRMAPLHHHFELGGWPETTVIVRFWIIAGLCVAVAMGLFYADFLSTGAGGL